MSWCFSPVSLGCCACVTASSPALVSARVDLSRRGWGAPRRQGGFVTRRCNDGRLHCLEGAARFWGARAARGSPWLCSGVAGRAGAARCWGPGQGLDWLLPLAEQGEAREVGDSPEEINGKHIVRVPNLLRPSGFSPLRTLRGRYVHTQAPPEPWAQPARFRSRSSPSSSAGGGGDATLLFYPPGPEPGVRQPGRVLGALLRHRAEQPPPLVHTPPGCGAPGAPSVSQ